VANVRTYVHAQLCNHTFIHNKVSTIFVVLKEANPFSPFYWDILRTPIPDMNDKQFKFLWEGGI
jgi:hypothetical protein